ncbi:hypothetical protein QG37_04322 [Candidozyma auris]|uniref:Uncharacterized protein n=1 Tax=Candidozyma auris TaxID=498019 RepID=A0A0L0NXA4_CANAR|nr:hypothetical protein QG37_04322 [[Candida] auris]
MFHTKLWNERTSGNSLFMGEMVMLSVLEILEDANLVQKI